MPGPDPGGIVECFMEDGRWIVGHHWRWGRIGGRERRNRMARIHAIIRNVRFNGWACRYCGAQIGLDKRADAVYCSARCRGKAYRDRCNQP